MRMKVKTGTEQRNGGRKIVTLDLEAGGPPEVCGSRSGDGRELGFRSGGSFREAIEENEGENQAIVKIGAGGVGHERGANESQAGSRFVGAKGG
jgi:hypothetical protein